MRGKKCTRPYNYMSSVVEVSFFHPTNVGFFNSKLGLVAYADRTINWLRPYYITTNRQVPLTTLICPIPRLFLHKIESAEKKLQSYKILQNLAIMLVLVEAGHSIIALFSIYIVVLGIIYGNDKLFSRFCVKVFLCILSSRPEDFK